MVKKRLLSPHVYPLPRAPFADMWHSLPKNCELREIIDEALDALKENRLAGIAVPMNKIPKSYLQAFGITNLFKMNLRGNYRLTYTLITKDEGVCPHVIEVMTHPEYLKRFGYRKD